MIRLFRLSCQQRFRVGLHLGHNTSDQRARTHTDVRPNGGTLRFLLRCRRVASSRRRRRCYCPLCVRRRRRCYPRCVRRRRCCCPRCVRRLSVCRRRCCCLRRRCRRAS